MGSPMFFGHFADASGKLADGVEHCFPLTHSFLMFTDAGLVIVLNKTCSET